MKNKVLFFSIDRLGDYFIRSNVIFNITKYYKTSEIICSNLNSKLINKQSFFDKIYVFDTSKKNINKIKYIINFFYKKYDSVICFDGKNISNILVFLIRANFKYVFIYKKYGFLNNLKTKLYCSLLNFLNIKYEILYNRKIIENVIIDHYPNKFKSLKKYYNNINDETYYLSNFELDKDINFNNRYILIHLDEKFEDIKNINLEFSNALNMLAKNSNKKIILTSFKNDHKYYKNLSIKKIVFRNLDQINSIKEKIYSLEDVPLKEFNFLINKSDLNISCHGGFFVHSSLYNKKMTIDLINFSQKKWLSAWVTPCDNYKIMYKSDLTKKIDIRDIIKKLSNEIK